MIEEADVVILGAGVAGLFAAYELIKQDFKGTITIVEQGQGMEKRLISNHAMRNALTGVGGPGLFTDGKICISGQAGTRLTDFISSDLLESYAKYIAETLQSFLPEDDLIPSHVDPDALDPITRKLQTVGLEMALAYPVIYLGSDRIRRLGLSLEAFLKAHNVRLLTETTAQELKLDLDSIEIKLERGANNTSIRCEYLIAAVGKSGHDWLCKQLSQRNIAMHPNTPDIGIRLEFPNSVTQQLLKIVQNPRITMKWNNTSIRTHCWCYGGHISTYDYLGSPLVDGEAFNSSLTEYTSVNLLYRFAYSEHDAVKEVRTLLQKIFQIGQGHALTQSLGGMRGEKLPHQLFNSHTSYRVFRQAQLGRIFPKIILEGFLEFIRRMNEIWPGTANSSTLVYTPIIEWDTYRLEVDKAMLTTIPRIYAVGDGAGLTQGVVAAATSGLIAATHLTQTYRGRNASKQPLEPVRSR